jgi:hypothetical protein
MPWTLTGRLSPPVLRADLDTSTRASLDKADTAVQGQNGTTGVWTGTTAPTTGTTGVLYVEF